MQRAEKSRVPRHRGTKCEHENPISRKRGLWGDVLAARLVLSKEELIINIYFPLRLAYGEKFLYMADIAEISFIPLRGNERVQSHHALVSSTHLLNHLLK
ncbi:hypothetical protein TNCV_3249971 [Trichonephila clavipes]|nr:hypothetical protein TNCV_3249971 [Trichonephila clavipes]